MPSALNLTVVSRKFEEFKKCLSLANQDVWERFREEQRVNNQDTEQGFQECLRLFRAKYIKGDALANQQTYFLKYTKPNYMECDELCDHLLEINQLTRVLNDGEPLWTELNLKVFFFSMMPQRYQVEFGRSADRDITDPTYSLDALVAVMQAKKIAEDMQGTNRRRQEGPQGDQRPQQMRRFNNGGRGWNDDGRWNYNNNLGGRGRGFNGNNNEEPNNDGEDRGLDQNNGREGGNRNFGGRGFDNRNGGRGNFGRGGFGRGRGNDGRGNDFRQGYGNGRNGRNGNNNNGGNHDGENFQADMDDDDNESQQDDNQQDDHWLNDFGMNH